MSNEKNLDLDIEHRDVAEDTNAIVRIAVATVSGFTRTGSAPTISLDCTNLRTLEKEVARLKGELDRCLQQGDAVFSGRRATAASRDADDHASAAAVETATPKPSLESGLSVQDVMTRELQTLRRNDPLVEAEKIMRAGHLRHVLVLEDDGKLAGLLSHRDIFYNQLSRSMGHGKFAHDSALEGFPVKQVMQTSLVTIAPEAPLGEAATLMMERGIGCLPVVDGDELVGLLTAGDFLAVLSPGVGPG